MTDIDNLKHKGKGPHGLGDPDDTSLRKVEKDVLIIKLLRERSKKEKCFKEYADFGECAKEHGLAVVYKCRKQNEIMMNCLEHWFHNEEFREDCKKQYLEERAEFRRTGLTKMQREAAQNNS